jgi:NAD(P)-dependent dehydrogenase (short-subunit alcohol dehydrogenase family)
VKPVVLITDAQTPLGESLVKLYLAKGCAVAATRSNQQSVESPLVSKSEDFLLVDWSRRSPISTRNVLLSALNRFQRIDQAIVLLSPSLERGLLHELSYETVERAVDCWIKGTLFLLKSVLELYRRQSPQSECVLALVGLAAQEEGTPFPPLEAALRGSFEATALSLFSSYNSPNIRVHGFQGFGPQLEGFAEYIVESLSAKSSGAPGRWQRFPARGRLLGGLKIGRS